MRRTFGYIALVVGLELIFLAPLLRWYSYPRVAKAPTDVSNISISDGTGSYFSARTLQLVGPVPLRNVSVAKGEPKASNHDVAVISIFTRTYNVQTAGDIDYTQDIYAMDRVSGYAVHCCGERPRHVGLTLKFPFGTEKTKTYQFYDSTAHLAFPTRYVDTETVAGLKSYKFVSEVPPTLIETMSFPGYLLQHPDEPNVTALRYYQATTTLWVEPFTGAILKAGQKAKQWVTDSAGNGQVTLADTDFLNTPATVEDTARQIRTKFTQLKAVRDWLPIGGRIVGVLLVVVSLLVLLRPRRPARTTVTGAGSIRAETPA